MGTKTPVKVLLVGFKEIAPEFAATIENFRTAGHIIDIGETTHNLQDYDLLVGPKCWYSAPELLQFFALAIKNAQTILKLSGQVAAAKPAKATKARAKKSPGGTQLALPTD